MVPPVCTSEFKHRLIALVKEYPWLWQKEHKDFKDSKLKQNSWMEIGVRLGQSGKPNKISLFWSVNGMVNGLQMVAEPEISKPAERASEFA